MERFRWVSRIISLVAFLAGEFMEAAADGRITVREIVEIGIKTAERLGFEVDTEGVDLEKLLG